jgi:NAD(P)-dependent dehydrogenase (short-subunit alcohol dehydrogenase family)
MKTYVVNGAAHPGFGENTMRELISLGCKVIGLYYDEDIENAKNLLKQFSPDQLELIRINVFDFDLLKKAVTSIKGTIDGFVNASFTFEMEDVNCFNYQLAEKLFRANYHAPMLMAIELKKLMKKGSSIVFVTSTESERGSYGGISYAASKAAVHNMIKSLACNWGKDDKIRVNAVAAGWIGGEMDTDGPFEVSMNITPLGRLGKAEEISSVISFLLSDKASFINAQVLYVDGGYLAVDDISKYEFEASKE